MANKPEKARHVPEHMLHKEHKGHGKHLCALVHARKMDLVADYARGARYICHICGRAAAKMENLCEAVKI